MEKWNYQGHIIGPPGSGKTFLARQIAHQHLESGGWVVVHDPAGQYRDLCRTYPSVTHWRVAATDAVRGRSKLHRGAAIGGTAPSEVLVLARELGERWRDRHRLLVIIDEGSLLATSGRSGDTWIKADDNVLVSMRRHWGLGLLFLQQRVNQIAVQFYDMATDVYVFRLANPTGLNKLEEHLGVAEGTLLESVPHLPDRAHVHVRAGEGVV